MKSEDAILDELLAARQNAKTLEGERRVDLLLEKCLTVGPERLRDARVIDILEAIGAAEAQDVLRSWADGAAQSRLTRQARAALQRLVR